MKKITNLLLVMVFITMTLSLVGCNSNQETSSQATEQEIAKVTASARLAEEKITVIFDKYIPEDSDTIYYVGKERYTSIEQVKEFLNMFYTEEMTNSIVENYIRIEEVPGIGQTTTLNLPEDYISIVGYEFTENDIIDIQEEKAILAYTLDEKLVKYTLIKVENEWLVDSKIVN